jgi:MoaD family protein
LKVTVRFFTHLREIVGKREDCLEFPLNEKVNVNNVLRTLSKCYGKSFEDYLYDSKTGKVKGYLQLLVNGRNVTDLDDFETKLEDGDVLAIIPPVGGG